MDFAIICAGLLLFGLGMYVILDGFDLGVGILFPWAPTDDCRNVMMSSIAPVWDGNETWLIYGGGLLFAAFPFAYSIILSALYLPIMLLILALILRGVAFEFRLKAVKSRWLWDFSFTTGSILAAFGDDFGSIFGLKSTSKSMLILTTIQICFFLKFRSQRAALRPSKTRFSADSTAL